MSGITEFVDKNPFVTLVLFWGLYCVVEKSLDSAVRIWGRK
jgi:hypothetical protein